MKKPIKLETDYSGVPPPEAPTVDYDRKPVLYTPDGKPLTRKVGF